ncbi:MAG: preprotein translocase subunit SecG [Cytophagaceae bacterium]|jgi:preprotein translocase subunit SecG|nr:preprotein translocase subunit SecG [Cytophagaceae bacterium]
MIIAISILLILAAGLMVLVVLAQNSKGGVADGFSSSTQIIGTRKTGDFLSNFTMILAVAILAFSITFNYTAKPTDDLDTTEQTEKDEVAEEEPTEEDSTN